MKKGLILTLVATSAFAGWFNSDVENALDKAKNFQCKSLEQNIKADLLVLQTENTRETRLQSLERLDTNVPMMGTRCNKDYNDLNEQLRDLRIMVQGSK